MKTLNTQEIQTISGGLNWETIEAVALTTITVLEIPHIIMGLREFTNYMADRWVNGATNIEEGDYFTHFLLYPFK